MATFKGRKHYDATFKLKVCLDFQKIGIQTFIKNKYNISNTSIRKWYADYLEKGICFETKSGTLRNKNTKINWRNPIFNKMNLVDKIKYEAIILEESTNWSRYKIYIYINNVSKNNKFSTRYLCNLLNVGKSSYYDWINKGKPKIKAYKKSIEKTVLEWFDNSKIKYGYRRLKHLIENQTGEVISYFLVLKYMRLNNRVGKSNKRNPKTSSMQKDVSKTINYINYDFRATNPNEKWYIDYTYVKVNGKWNYIAFIKDGWNNEIVNWHVLTKRAAMETKKLIKSSIRGKDVSKLVIHTDQGVEFKNGLVIEYLQSKEIVQSFGFKSIPTSNAAIETLMSTFKRDFNPNNEIIQNKKHLQKIVSEFVFDYNEFSPQKGLNWLSPKEFSLI